MSDLDIEQNHLKPPVGEYVELWWGDPAKWSWSEGSCVKIGMAISEARSLKAAGRKKAIENILAADLLICPSEASAVAYRESPYDGDIRIVPFGVGSLSYVKRKWSRSSPMKFLLAGAAQFRKGTWLGVEAYLSAVRKCHRSTLTVWSSVKTPMRRQLKNEYGKHPKIVFDDERKDSPAAVYEEHHVLLSPHLSEGFGLMIPEAMSTGMACIISKCSAPLEYFSNDYGWWIDMSDDYAPVADCLEDTGGLWRLPDVHSLADRMVYAYGHRNECMEKGRAASLYVLQNMTWLDTARNILAAIEGVLDEKGLGSVARLQRGDPSASLPGSLAASC
jgi:glycosyltransferase involved in cell wall biosynthesis